jgi:hypothetical protein
MFDYLLNYDPFATDPTPQKLIEFVRSNTYTYQFLVPFAGSVFIKSEASLRELVASYTPFLRPTPFSLTVLAPELMSGLLPLDYWQWLNSQQPAPINDLLAPPSY